MANPELGLPEFHRNPNLNPNEFWEAMQFQRELEKERIRAEIIAEEIMRRRILEEEVRREMMMEKEMAMRFGYADPMRFEPRVPPLLTNFEHRERFGLAGIGVSPHRETGFRGFETRPFQRDPGASASGAANGTPSNVTLQEIKGGSTLEVAKDKVIILAKPTVTAADLKRKAATQPNGATAELISGGSKKQKTKDDWSCALCRVSATSERGLNEHLQGKKHKAKERGLLTQKTGFGTSPLPKKAIRKKRKHIKTRGLESSPTSKNEDKKAEGGTGSNLAQKKEDSAEKQNGESAMPKHTPGSAKPKKKLRFWCEVCKVGAHSQKVMDAHQKGKRHSATLSELIQTGKTETIIPGKLPTENVATDETKQETVGEQVVIEEANVNNDNNPTTTDDKDKKSSDAVCSDVLVVENENNRVDAANGTDS